MIKNYLKTLKINTKDNGVLYFTLFIFLFIYWIKTNQGEFVKLNNIIFGLFFLSFVIQNLMLIKFKYSIYVFRMFLIIFYFVELYSRIMLSRAQPFVDRFMGEITINDSIIGYKLKPNAKGIREYLKIEKDTIYDVLYYTDQYGRRIYEKDTNLLAIDSKSHYRKHAIFLGCSFTFGTGLDYKSTFPSQFEEIHTEYKSYNYGVLGWGPHQFCNLFNRNNSMINNSTVNYDSGFCLYTYIDAHLDRVYGGSDYLTWGNNTPDVFIKGDSIFNYKRSSNSILLSKMLNMSQTFKFLNIKSSYPKTDEFYKRFADIINYTAKKYWEIKPNGQFFIGLYPNSSQDTKWTQFLNKKIKVVKVKTPNDYAQNYDTYRFPKIDGHPKGKLNLYYMNEVIKGLE